MTSDSQALVLFQPSPVLQAMYTKEVSFRIPWTGPPDVCSHPPTLTLEQGGEGTGGTAWVAGSLLAQFLAMHHDRVFSLLPPCFRDARRRQWKDSLVVELGAGLGLVSIVAAMLGAKVVATDGEDTVVTQLAANADRYRHLFAHGVAATVLQWKRGSDPAPIIAQALGNATAGDAAQRSPRPDIVLAADVVYGHDTSVWSDLVYTLERLLGVGVREEEVQEGRKSGREEERGRASRGAEAEAEAGPVCFLAHSSRSLCVRRRRLRVKDLGFRI
jgi:hypothetical protein